jgi:6-phosphofructokinase 1
VLKNKIIAILTSGGDAPGMNACIRAITKTALKNSTQVLGIRRGFNGLIEKDFFQITFKNVSDIIHRGGTILCTARSEEFKSANGVKKAVSFCKEQNITGVIAIGGDGTFKGAKKLCEASIPCVCIPGTIDNDIGCSEYTIGFDTATNTAVDMIDKLQDTAQSHERCSLVEVMGRHCGRIALCTGIAVGATAIVIPEIPYNFEKDILSPIKFRMNCGKHHFIIVISEGVGDTLKISKKIKNEAKIETRITVLGHVQRGGSPTSRDRIVATKMGYKAADLLINGVYNRIIAVKNGKITDLDIKSALNIKKEIGKSILKIF